MQAKRVLVIGAESTGKSTLTENLAQFFIKNGVNAIGIQEWAREWIDDKLEGDMNRLEYEHITNFGITQMQLVDVASKKYELVISDTDAIVSSIFQDIYYNKVDEELKQVAYSEKWNLVLLTHVDVPWVDDGQRNLSHIRFDVHKRFEDKLKELGFVYIDVTGTWEERLKTSISHVQNLL